MQKLEGQEDLRVQRTRTLLQQALFELTIEKGFAAVTVRDITHRAMVNRSTFYRHYLDKYDLLNHYLDELQALTAEAALLAEKANQNSSEKVPAGLLILIKHVQEYGPGWGWQSGAEPVRLAHSFDYGEGRSRRTADLPGSANHPPGLATRSAARCCGPRRERGAPNRPVAFQQ